MATPTPAAARDGRDTPPVDLARNTLFAGIGNASNVLLLALLILAGRRLGVEDFGTFSFALALVTIFALGADLGTTEIAKRRVARDPDLARATLARLLAWKTLLALVSFAALIVTIRGLGATVAVQQAVALLGAAMLLKSFKRTLVDFLQAFEHFAQGSLLVLAHNAALLLGGGATLLLGGGVVALAATFLAVRCADLALAVVMVHRHVAPVGLRIDPVWIRRIQGVALGLGLYALVVEVHSYVDTVMLSLLRDAHEVGLYNAGYKLFDGLMVLPMVLCQALAPQLARLHRSDPEAHGRLADRAARYAAAAAFGVTGLGLLLADDVLRGLFGLEFAGAAPAFRILLAAFGFAFGNFLCHTLLVSIDRQRALAPIGIVTLVANVALNAVAIPLFGGVGAALATAASSGLACVLGLRALAAAGRPVTLIPQLTRPVLAALLVFGSIGVFGPGGWRAACAAGAAYGVLLFVSGVLGRDELSALARLWPGRGARDPVAEAEAASRSSR